MRLLAITPDNLVGLRYMPQKTARQPICRMVADATIQSVSSITDRFRFLHSTVLSSAWLCEFYAAFLQDRVFNPDAMP